MCCGQHSTGFSFQKRTTFSRRFLISHRFHRFTQNFYCLRNLDGTWTEGRCRELFFPQTFRVPTGHVYAKPTASRETAQLWVEMRNRGFPEGGLMHAAQNVY